MTVIKVKAICKFLVYSLLVSLSSHCLILHQECYWVNHVHCTIFISQILMSNYSHLYILMSIKMVIITVISSYFSCWWIPCFWLAVTVVLFVYRVVLFFNLFFRLPWPVSTELLWRTRRQLWVPPKWCWVCYQVQEELRDSQNWSVSQPYVTTWQPKNIYQYLYILSVFLFLLCRYHCKLP